MSNTYPCKFYPTWGKLQHWAYTEAPASLQTVTIPKFSNLLNNVSTLFDGTHVNPYKPIYDSDGNITGYDYLREIMDEADLKILFEEQYLERMVVYPARVGYANFSLNMSQPQSYDDAMLRVLNQFSNLFDNWYRINHWRYAQMLGALDLEYDPIENYNLNEEGGNEEDFNKTISSKASNEVHGTRITAPVTAITQAAGATPDVPDTVTATLAVDKTVQDAEVEKPADFTHSVASYEDTNAVKVEYVDSVGVAGNKKDVKQTAVAEVWTGSSENPFDTHTEGHRNLTRRGNIGVTTTQQMLESELELRRKNIIQQMIDDIAGYVFLGVY